MPRRLVRLAIAGSVLVCCADLSGLQGKDTDASGADGSAEGAAQAGDAESSRDGTATFPKVSCDDAGPDVLYCATFEPGTLLPVWGSPEGVYGGEVSLDPTQGASAPGALLAKVPAHDASAGYVKARLRAALLTSIDRFRISFSMRVSLLANDENLVGLDFGSYVLTFKTQSNAGAVAPELRETEPADGGSVYTYTSVAYAQPFETWQRYELDMYRSENGGTASHVDIRVAGKTFSFPLRAHLYPATKVEVSYGFVGSDVTTINETVVFDDVVVEAL